MQVHSPELWIFTDKSVKMLVENVMFLVGMPVGDCAIFLACKAKDMRDFLEIFFGGIFVVVIVLFSLVLSI